MSSLFVSYHIDNYCNMGLVSINKKKPEFVVLKYKQMSTNLSTSNVCVPKMPLNVFINVIRS